MRQPIINFDCQAVFNSKNLLFQVDEIVKYEKLAVRAQF